MKKSFIICILHQIVIPVTKLRMRQGCRKHGNDEKFTKKKILERPEGKIPRHGRGDNNKMDLKGIGFEVMDWTDLAQNRVQWRDPVTR
jgi:hypothetical protein